MMLLTMIFLYLTSITAGHAAKHNGDWDSYAKEWGDSPIYFLQAVFWPRTSQRFCLTGSLGTAYSASRRVRYALVRRSAYAQVDVVMTDKTYRDV